MAVPVDLSKLSDVVKNDIVKKKVYDKLVAKANNIDTTGFVLQNTYDIDKSDLEKEIRDANKKIPDTNDLIKKRDLDVKVSELKNKIPNITGLATNAPLTAVENKIPNVSDLGKKAYYDSKISGIEKNVTDHDHDKYITTSEFNKRTTENFKARLAQANLVTKTDFDAKLTSVDRKINSTKTKHLLVENSLKKLNTFDLSYLIGKSYFNNDGAQLFLKLFF